MEDLSFDRYTVQPVRDRSKKVARRKGRMPVNGIAMKRLLNERAAEAQAEASHRRMHLLTGTLLCAGDRCVLR